MTTHSSAFLCLYRQTRNSLRWSRTCHKILDIDHYAGGLDCLRRRLTRNGTDWNGMKSLINHKHSRRLKIHLFSRRKEIIFEYRKKRKKTRTTYFNFKMKTLFRWQLSTKSVTIAFCYSMFSFEQFVINPSLLGTFASFAIFFKGL